MIYQVWYRADKCAEYLDIVEAQRVCNEIFEKTGVLVALTARQV
jgi:predicted secreted protein